MSYSASDIYFKRAVTILESQQIEAIVAMEIFSNGTGTLCGIEEAKILLKKVLLPGSEVWALADGDQFDRKEVVLRIKAPYTSFGVYETAILGMLAHGSGWATASRECVQAAKGIPVISFGARHVHPSVVGIMDYAAVVGGCVSCSSSIGAELSGTIPSGTMPHTLILIMGNTIKAAKAFDACMPPEVPRIVLVDTFKDEVEESVNVSITMGDKLDAVRLDTPAERGGVTPHLVKEVRAALDLIGSNNVKIVVSGGITPQRIATMLEENAPVDSFGVGSYISGARPIDFTADIHEVESEPVAKRGRIPGITENPRLKPVLV